MTKIEKKIEIFPAFCSNMVLTNQSLITFSYHLQRKDC
jgi:hypothetical protein